MEISGLDEIDNRILELLRENARMSYSEIGNAVGKSRVAVKTRIDQLEKKGIIRGYHAEIDVSAQPGGIRFFLDIETEPQCYEEVLMKLSLSKLIHKIYGTSGECHIHAIGIVPNSETLGSYAGHLYCSAKGMRRLSWQILITTYKDMERGVEYEIRYQENVISQTGNQITVQFENEVRTFVLDEKYAARPRFEDDEQIVSAFTQYGRVKERIKKIQKELASLRS